MTGDGAVTEGEAGLIPDRIVCCAVDVGRTFSASARGISAARDQGA